MQGGVLKLKLDVLELEHLAVLAHHGVLGLGQDRHQIVLVERLRLGNDGRTSHKLGNHAKGVEVLREHLTKQIVLVDRGGAGDLGVKAHALVAHAIGDDLIQTHKGTAADEQDVRRVDLQQLLLGMLAAAGGRNACHRALKNLKQRLLNALARDITGDGEVLCLAGDLVDLVHVDDAHLRALDIAIGGVDELEQDVLHVLANVASLGERGGVSDGKRHLEDACERLGQQRLTGTGGAEQQNVGLGELYLVHIVVKLAAHTVSLIKGGHRGTALDHATVVVVHGHRHGALGVLLAHNIGRKLVIDLVRCRHVRDDLTVVLKLKALGLGVNGGLGRSLAVIVEEARQIAVAGGVHKVRSQRLLQDLRAGGDTLVADKDVGRTLYETTDLALLFSAEGAADGVAVLVKVVLHVTCHPRRPSRRDRAR